MLNDKISKGQLVNTPDGYWIGRFLGECGDSIGEVELTRAPGLVHTKNYRMSDLRRAVLDPQTRVFFKTGESSPWMYGRVLSHTTNPNSGDIEYEIQFPNKEFRLLSESLIQVRTLTADIRPDLILEAKAFETQYFHDRRNAVLDALTHFRSAGVTFSGALSSSIVLLPHQISAVRRVLRDPVQRYLLADEVGLGKTIEAGCIIRQWHSENEEAEILVLVPRGIARQWKLELEVKFRFDLDEAPITICSFEDFMSGSLGEYTYVVIDEAHNLIAGATSDSEQGIRLRELAYSAEKLLLLSATPVLADVKLHQSLLNLLDQHSFPLGDIEEFERLVTNRQPLGQLLLALDPEIPNFLVKSLVQEILNAFDGADQDEVRELAAGILDHADDDNVRPQLIRNLRSYIADTYRIHQRVIRSRRSDNSQLFRSRSGPINVQLDEDDRLPYLESWLEEFRVSSLDELSLTNQQDLRVDEYADRFARLIDGLSGGVDAFASELDRQIEQVTANQLPTFTSDLRLLEQAKTYLDLEQGLPRVETVSTTLFHILLPQVESTALSDAKKARIVVFGSNAESIEKSANHLKEYAYPLRNVGIFTLTKNLPVDRLNETIGKFASFDGAAFLFCDQIGEEGVNLQFAHAICHLDLPFSPTRIEQRLGRLDRLGRSAERILHTFVIPAGLEKSSTANWLTTLEKGFSVFEKSISDVQFIVDPLLRSIKNEMYLLGDLDTENWIERIANSLDDERRKLAEQDAFDRLGSESNFEGDFAQVIDRADNPSNAVVLDLWLCGALQFRKYSVNNYSFRYKWERERTLVAFRPWFNRFSSHMDTDLTFRRDVAVMKPGVQIVRPGNKLVDELMNYLMAEDRGVAFATAKLRRRSPYSNKVVFKVVYVVEGKVEFGDVMHDSSADETQIIRRRVDEIFPPWIDTVWLNPDMTPIEDSDLLELAVEPYRTEDFDQTADDMDINLGSRPELLAKLVSSDELNHLVNFLRQGDDLHLTQPIMKPNLGSSIARASQTILNDIGRLQKRANRIRSEFGIDDQQIEKEVIMLEKVRRAIQLAGPRLDSVGVIVVVNEIPN